MTEVDVFVMQQKLRCLQTNLCRVVVLCAAPLTTPSEPNGGGVAKEVFHLRYLYDILWPIASLRV